MVIDYISHAETLERMSKSSYKNIDFSSEEKIRMFWDELLSPIPFYHGTNSYALGRIRETGSLHPIVRYWDDDFMELKDLIIKAGHEQFSTMKPGKVFLTAELSGARGYTSRSPEVWTFLVGDYYWKINDSKRAFREVTSQIVCHYFASVRADMSKLDDFLDSNPSDIEIAENSFLNVDQVRKTRELFFKYWNNFSDAKPVVLVFDKEIVKSIGGVFDNLFDYNIFRTLISENEEWAKRTVGDIFGRINMETGEPISLDHLIVVEEVHR